MADYVHLDENHRIDGTAPECNSDGTKNISESDIEIGWFEWPFEEEIPEEFFNYKIVDGELVYDEFVPEPSTEPTMDDLVNAIMELAELIGE